jgi:heme/copper-type cytochrome/quinol oxidase subunit 2
MRVGGLIFAGVLSALASGAWAAEPATVTLALKDHRFTPPVLNVPAGQRIQIELVNLDKATEEFDSHDLRIEKLVTPNGKIRFFVGPLKPGTYMFEGEFHAATAQGRIIVAKAQ